MDYDEITTKAYLQAVYDATQGDPEIQVSMHEVGIPIGYDKAESGRMAEELMVNGYIELKTLAGGISLTGEGLDYLGFRSAAAPGSATAQLSGELVITDHDRSLIEQISAAIKTEMAGKDLEYAAVEQVVFDLKAIELHLLSPQPKTAVILELFQSLETVLPKSGIGESTGLSALLQNR